MRKFLLLALLLLLSGAKVRANEGWHDWCWNGSSPVLTSGLTSTTLVQASSPLCQVTVFVHGGGVATIFADNAGTPLANPFTGQTNGQFLWYAANGRYDQTITTTINGIVRTVTMSDILLCDPAASGSCGPPVSGCTPSGVNTGVISEHPTGSCYDSVDWTWDDGASKQNMQQGLNNTLGTGSPLAMSFTWGQNNQICNNGTEGSPGCSYVFTMGLGNTSVDGNRVFAFGDSNSVYENAPVGSNAEPQNAFVVGSNQQLNFYGTGTQAFMSNVHVVGDGGGGSQLYVNNYNAEMTDAYFFGFQNSATADGTGTSGSQTTEAQDFYVVGEFNSLSATSAGLVSKVYGLGESATISAAASQTFDAVFVGSNDTIANTTGSPVEQMVFGHNLTLNNCSHCYLIGETATNSTSNYMGIGLSSTPEIQITPGSVTIAGLSVTVNDVKYIRAANCNNATAGNAWSIGSGGTITCRAGTNNKGGYVAITDTSTTFAQFNIPIPKDWNSAVNPYLRFDIGYPGTDTGHTIIPAIQVSCQKGDGTTTDDVTFNASHSASTITTNATANQYWSNSTVQMNSTDVTGCVAGSLMVIQVGRATDSATSAANFYGVTYTVARSNTQQAN